MKSPQSLSGTCDRSINQLVISVPGTTKKVKRKSREPKRLNSFPVDGSDVDSTDEACNVSMHAPRQRQLVMSQEAMASARRTLSIPEASLAPAQSTAIDMRIGMHVPAVASKLSQLPTSTLSHPEISHWPSAIYQPLSTRLKLGFCPTFPLPPSTSSHSPSLPAFALDPTLPVARASQSSQCRTQVESPQESPRKRVGVSDDGPGHLPEVKAIQQTRRLLANARERTRVHTISAAFEALRKQIEDLMDTMELISMVPCYSYGQKLSKLAILRIACNYILSLAQLAELDYSSDHSSLSFSQCVEQCTKTLQAEGRSKKRKE